MQKLKKPLSVLLAALMIVSLFVAVPVTASAEVVTDEYVANIGDSRCYLLSRFTRRIRQITIDHSLVEEYVRAGIITREEARNHPKKNIITRAIGSDDPKPEADIYKLRLQGGQALLLCSDGLSNSVADKDILNSFLQIPTDPEKLCRHLLELAFQGGAGDNVTMFVVVRT